MAIQFSTDWRNDALNAIQTSGAMVLKIFDGAKPANCAAADAGVELVSMTLPNPAFTASTAASLVKTGTWQGTATASGSADYWRLYESDGTTCRAQGDVVDNDPGGGDGNLELDQATTDIVEDQVVTVSAFTVTIGGG